MKIRLLVFTALVFLVSFPTASVSQIKETTWTADIPFDFIISDHHMAAGQYLIKSNAQTMRLTVINKETQEKRFMFTRNVEKLDPSEKTVLVFQREGDRHVLHQIWGQNETRGHDVVHGGEVIELTKVK